MKNKDKIIIFFVIILTIILLSTIVCITLFSSGRHICKIISINGDDIIVELLENTNKENISDSITKKQYIFSISNILIKNEEEKKINKTELQAGDIICVTYKKEKTKVDLAYSIEPLHNVKSIQLWKEPQQ